MSLNLICSLDCWEGRVTYSGYPGACKGRGGHNLIVEGQGRGLGLLKIESRIDIIMIQGPGRTEEAARAGSGQIFSHRASHHLKIPLRLIASFTRDY